MLDFGYFQSRHICVLIVIMEFNLIPFLHWAKPTRRLIFLMTRHTPPRRAAETEVRREWGTGGNHSWMTVKDKEEQPLKGSVLTRKRSVIRPLIRDISGPANVLYVYTYCRTRLINLIRGDRSSLVIFSGQSFIHSFGCSLLMGVSPYFGLRRSLIHQPQIMVIVVIMYIICQKNNCPTINTLLTTWSKRVIYALFKF